MNLEYFAKNKEFKSQNINEILNELKKNLNKFKMNKIV